MKYVKAVQGLPVIGGATPTGTFPKVIGEGIFGYNGENEGIFSGEQWPENNDTGIFFNPYAFDEYEQQESDTGWRLERRPGEPLYPGSSARGIVLVGPSMGQDDGEKKIDVKRLLLSLAVIGGIGYVLLKMTS